MRDAKNSFKSDTPPTFHKRSSKVALIMLSPSNNHERNMGIATFQPVWYKITAKEMKVDFRNSGVQKTCIIHRNVSRKPQTLASWNRGTCITLQNVVS